MTETATTTIDTESHWQWVRDLIGEATAGVETDDEIDGWLRTSTGYAIPAGPAADTEVAETGTCQSCGRTLTSAASIARGRGPRCAAKIRRAARLAAELLEQTGYKVHQLASAVELIEDAAIIPLPVARAYVAVSSDGHEFYECTADTCGCKAAENDRKCYHRLSAAILDAA